MEPYRSKVLVGPEETQALLLVCSDRRYRAATNDLMENRLGITSYDVVAVPGSTCSIAGGSVESEQGGVVMGMVDFLMENHVPPRLVVVSHQDCAGYLNAFRTSLGLPGFSIERRQIDDLKSVRRALLELFGGTTVDAFFARSDADGAIEFEPAE
jgi:hypothetical protein